jgi:flagellar assembly protein FliH
MAIIKSAKAKALESRAAPIKLGDMHRPVRDKPRPRYTMRAVERRRAARAEARGYREGFACGRRAGRRAARQQGQGGVEALVSVITSAVDRWEAERQAELTGVRSDALALILEVVRRVVHRTIEIDEKVVIDQLESALTLISAEAMVEAHVHPDDLSILHDARLPIRVTLVGDPEMERGGCRLETSMGVVDAAIETQLQRLTEAIVR